MHISPRRPRKEAQVPLSIRDEPNVFPDTLDGLEDHQRDGGSMTPPLAHPASTLAPSTRIVEPEYRPSKTARHQDPGRPQSTRSKQTSTKPTRPGLQRRRTTARTRYIDMLLGLDHVSPFHNFLASLCVWILLAGYIVFPATFTKLQNEEIEDKTNNRIKAAALQTVRNVPLLYVASFACAIGVVGCLWLWWKHRKNYVWVINRIFLPALLNSIAGLISTIVNVYTAQDGQYSVTATITIIVSSACSVVAAALFLLYNTVMLRLVKRKHEKEVKAAEGEERRWHDNDGYAV